MVVDASPNAMQIIARNAMVRDKTVGGFGEFTKIISLAFNYAIKEDFYDTQIANDVTSQSEEDDFPNDRRVRRQAESTEMVDMEQEPEMEEIQGIWQGMWQTMVEGAKNIVQKFAGSLDHAPGQAGNEN